MGYRTHARVLGLVAAVAVVAGCSNEDGPAATDTVYTLTCPEPTTGCGSFAPDTCLRPEGAPMGEREITGQNGDLGCDGENATIVVCEATETDDGRQFIDLEATMGGFGLETRIVASLDGTSVEGTCEVTILEDGLPYGGPLGVCGVEPPSMEQPCQISNITVGGDGDVDLSFDLLCEALLSDVTEDGFDVEATNIRFARCTGI